jgi:hypothetical protein
MFATQRLINHPKAMVSQMSAKLVFLRRPMCMTQIQTQQVDAEVVQRKPNLRKRACIQTNVI